LTKSVQLPRAVSWADSLVRDPNPPVNLFAVARQCGIKLLALRPIIPKGLLLPVGGGFEVYLRDPSRRDLDIGEPEPPDLLSPRQRFTLAHEIVHTKFYKKVSDSMPVPDNTVPNGRDLEDICDQVAGIILIPTVLIKRELTNPDEIDASLVRTLASKYRSSAAVVIERLAAVEPSNLFERCILLVRRRDGDAEIRSFYFGDGMLPLLVRPKPYSRLTEWMPDIPGSALQGHHKSDSSVVRKGRLITFTSVELSNPGEFLLQVQAVSGRSPVT
jgi:hypothetical protein